MSFPDWNEDHEAFRATARRFTREEIRPHADRWRKEGFPDELFAKAGALGLLGVRFDPKWGGSGLDHWYTVILVEELMRGRDIGAVVGLLVQCEMATSVIHAHGSDELRQERLVLSTMVNALCRDILEETRAYLEERSAFGRKLASMQVWRHRMADLVTDLEASELLTYRAADRLVSRDPGAELSVSMAKLHAAEMVRRLIPDCAQAFGGYGFMEENYVARCSRGVQNWGVGAGTSEMMREIIAKRWVDSRRP